MGRGGGGEGERALNCTGGEWSFTAGEGMQDWEPVMAAEKNTRHAASCLN